MDAATFRGTVKTARNRDAMLTLAIDIGGSQLGVALVDAAPSQHQATVRRKTARPLPPDCGAEQLLQWIDVLIGKLDEPAASAVSSSTTWESFERIGITIPGLADPEAGLWVYACFSGIRDFPIARILEARYGRPVFLDNDVNACALAERLFGCCRETRDFLWMTISNGIGGGLVIGGQIYRGAFGHAGEIGHFHVVDDGRRCGCGHAGCLEAEAAGPGIAHYYHTLFHTSPKADRATSSPDAKEIAARARAGEPEAIQTFERTGRLLGRASAWAANLLNPGKIVLGGGVGGAFELFYPALRETFEAEAFGDACSHVVIERTALGYDAATIGAAALCCS